MSDAFYFEACSSTNDEIETVLLYPADNFSAVYTFNQTQGRGQYGNTWTSKPGDNLAYSLAIKTSSVKHSHFAFNYYTAIAIRDYIANMTENDVKIKWPNDLILKNKKICGILIEKRKINGEEYFIVGSGINILQEKFDEISNAGSILTQTGKALNLKNFTENLHKHLVEKLRSIPDENLILKTFNHFLYRKDEISVFEKDGLRQNGIIRKADEKGLLWIEFETGMESFYHKEIKLLY